MLVCIFQFALNLDWWGKTWPWRLCGTVQCLSSESSVDLKSLKFLISVPRCGSGKYKSSIIPDCVGLLPLGIYCNRTHFTKTRHGFALKDVKLQCFFSVKIISGVVPSMFCSSLLVFVFNYSKTFKNTYNLCACELPNYQHWTTTTHCNYHCYYN